MLKDHRRLIRADEKQPGCTTHHIAKSGMVHSGHPVFCDDADCRQWAADLEKKENDMDVKMLNDGLREMRQETDKPILVTIVILTICLSVAVGIVIWRLTK